MCVCVGQCVKSVDTSSQVCNLAWSKTSNELVSTHGYSQNQIVVWKYPSMTQIVKLTGAYVYTYMYIYIYMYVLVYIPMYITSKYLFMYTLSGMCSYFLYYEYMCGYYYIHTRAHTLPY